MKLDNLYKEIYGESKTYSTSLKELKTILKTYQAARPNELKEMDKDPDWVFSSNLVGMTLYIDLFSTDFKHLLDKMDYFQELGITFIHLMPLLKPRPGESDGGYAVMDYQDVDPNLGTLSEFKQLLEAFRKHAIYVCIDYVINHVAKEHIWAKKALENDPYYQDMFIMFDTDEIPNLYNKTVPEVLPDKCPGNFTYYKEMNKYVFTSFSDFQWDLNFKNPEVFNGMVINMLYLANLGVNMIRLDAIPFMWKELGTSCRNLEPIHKLIEMLHLIKDEVCPSVALLGEAIVEPHEIIKYFGSNDHVECEVMYNANLMVNIFNSFSTRDARLLANDINTYRIPPTGAWMNYVRCHDDIGWGFNEEAIKSYHMDPFLHKQFLISFYNGSFKGSFARGLDYQYNPLTHDARTNGTLASLLGLQKATETHDHFEADTALKRIHLSNALILFYRGFPLIYSGDEIATLNSDKYLLDVAKKNEGRWVHRPYFDWQRAENRHIPYTYEYEVFQTLKFLIEKRKQAHFLDGRIKQISIPVSNHHVLVIARIDADNTYLGLYNFSEYPTEINLSEIKTHLKETMYQDFIYGRLVDFNQDTLNLSAYEYMWLTPKK